MLTGLLLLAIVGKALSAPTEDVVLHEKRDFPSFKQRTRVAEDAVLPVRIALTQSNLDKGYDYLLEVADPHSKKYGQHWTTEEIHAKFAPEKDTVNKVVSWLAEHGFQSNGLATSASRGWLSLEMYAREAEHLFSTQYFEEHDEAGRVTISRDEYVIRGRHKG